MNRPEESRNDIGMVRIHDNVIASIAALAAQEIEGVVGIDKNARSQFLELVARHKGARASIKVIKDKRGDITVTLPVVVRYGFNIPEVAVRVQENVRSSLEKMTSLSIRDINVNIQGIERG